MSTRLRIAMAVIGLAAVTSGCASREGSTEPAAVVSGSPVASIAVVTVEIDSGVGEDRVARFNEESGATVLRKAVEDKLSVAGRISHQGGPTMELFVTEFRLRSTSASLWLGSLAGNDNIKVRVAIRDAGRVIKTYEATSSTLLGGMIMPAADVRLSRICNGVAEDIVNRL